MSDKLKGFADSVAPAWGLPAVELAILSRPGGREYNEDACGHWHSDDRLCCVVADGAGGHGGGDVASRLAVRHIIEQNASAPLNSPRDVHDLLLDTNQVVRRHRGDAETQAHMHSTVVALFVDLSAGTALWGHAGDSRLFLFRGGRLLTRTKDHSLVQSLVDAGMLAPEQMQTHPRRSELHSALGSEPHDLMITTAEQAVPLQDGDAFLLCTDGLWEYVTEPDLCGTLLQAVHPLDWLSRLEELVLQNAAAAGKTRHDNFSGIAVWVGTPHG